MGLLLAFVFCLHFSPQNILGHADATSADNQFFAATKLLQDNKYDEAYLLFENEFKNGNDNPSLLYNWGLSAYHKKKLGMAVALWRRALFLNPELSPAAKALEFIADALPRGLNSDSPSLWQSLNNHLLNRISMNKLLMLLWLFFVPTAILLIRYWGSRMRALRNSMPLPHLPTVGIGFSILFTILLVLSVSKAISLLEIHATVVSTAATLRTGPSPKDNAIFDLVEGLDVIVRRAQNSWVLIALPTGLSGWVPGETLFQHSGKTKVW